ncbi:unnamed protein product [Adineta ricciae]|uniref:Uncharacterized protein n=1 Tax=Adineta ricciae TaxID=249248 RepID=A0A816CFH1_ADIRI|nr:unnamed protein product [Adineta ricciae]CAF1621276.1 unnamed protein product [Adineta ricciae]
MSTDWFYYIRKYGLQADFRFDDFRYIGATQFQALEIFCQMVNQTISNNLIQFYSAQYISAIVTPSHAFELQTQALLNQFKNLTKTNAFLLLDMIRGTTQANILYSGQETNYGVEIFQDSRGISVSPRSYNNCSCDYSMKCAYETRIYASDSQPTIFYIPGLLTGCYVIEAILQSTLECFYNKTCITQIQSYIEEIPSMNITPLDSSLPTQYSVNSTIQELLDHLMVEYWNISTTYEKYYNQCQPIQCTYTYKGKNTVIYIFNVLLGLLGGLITVLKVIVPIMVRFIRKQLRRQREIPTPEIRKGNK